MVLLWVLRGLPMVLLVPKWSVTLYYCICCNLFLVISHKYSSTRCSHVFSMFHWNKPFKKNQVYQCCISVYFLATQTVFSNDIFRGQTASLARALRQIGLFQEADRFLLLFCKHIVDNLVDVQGIGVSVRGKIGKIQVIGWGLGGLFSHVFPGYTELIF